MTVSHLGDDTRFRWTKERMDTVASGWRDGLAVRDIAASIGATRAMVISKARALKLGAHVAASEPQEPDRPVRMPRIGFQDRRFAWEGGSMAECAVDITALLGGDRMVEARGRS